MQRICRLLLSIAVQSFFISSVFSQFLEQSEKSKVFDAMSQDATVLGLLDATQSQINLEDLSRAFQHLEHQAQGLLSQKFFLDVNFKTVHDQIQTILQESNAINQELQHSLDAIREYQSKIAIAKQRLDVIIKEYNLHKEYFTVYVTLLYKIQNELYQDDGVSDWKLLIKSTDISTTLSHEEFVKIISDKIQFLLYDLQMQKQSYEAAIAQMNELYGNYQQKVDAFEQQLATIELQRKELLTLFQSIQQGQAEILQSLTAVEGEQKLIEQQQRLLTTTRKDEREKLDAVQRIISKDEREFGSKFLTRPALPVKKILYYFQDESWKQQEKSEHLGLRISIPQGSEVFSPAPAIVYKVYDHGPKNDLRWIVLLHKHGLVSVILPMSRIFVQEGQFVERGQILGTSGGKPQTRGAGNLQQPQLYRELYQHGSAIDPLLYLDTSIFVDSSSLLPKYWEKYKEDLFSRTIRVDEVTMMPGKTLQERIALFLSKYAPDPYNSLDVWLEGNKDTGIDPYFGICIGRAETSYSNFKSTNNIGNVGNDDSGNIRTYDTVFDGIAALYNVLNNKFLQNYHTMDQLSRYGNDDGFIYASSPYNRQNNIMKCLTAIYGYYIPEDYPFRRLK